MSGDYGLVNTLTKSPFELHLPGYQFCGPGTKLHKRLARGDRGINLLDAHCREHDIAYSQSSDIRNRNQADKKLIDQAWQRVKSKDSSLGEKTAAWLVTNIMKTKLKVGMGTKKKRMKQRSGKVCKFKDDVVNPLQKLNKRVGGNIQFTLKAAKKRIKRIGGKKKIKLPRVIPVPKTGGFLPLIPLFAGLSALGALIGGASGIAKAVNEAKVAKENLKESIRHNKTMEAVALGKGLYLKPYKQGLGLYLPPKN